MNKFPERLKLLRKEMGLTQTELAEKLGLKQVTVAKWEKGERTPYIDYFIELAKFFNCTIDFLVGLVDF